mmetsp:Transcript_18080/g.29320  ORF Transcript_18080/g.29320 Transcript_18080/m.29320 type:complete len:201 (+) Transcript_18080:1083-1685(+)
MATHLSPLHRTEFESETEHAISRNKVAVYGTRRGRKGERVNARELAKCRHLLDLKKEERLRLLEKVRCVQAWRQYTAHMVSKRRRALKRGVMSHWFGVYVTNQIVTAFTRRRLLRFSFNTLVENRSNAQYMYVAGYLGLWKARTLGVRKLERAILGRAFRRLRAPFEQHAARALLVKTFREWRLFMYISRLAKNNKSFTS